MSTVITNETYTLSVRKRVGAVAFGMLSGEVGFIEGAIELASLRHEAAVEENDSDFMVFVVIASETDMGRKCRCGKSAFRLSKSRLC